jgi:hypothetical protein
MLRKFIPALLLSISLMALFPVESTAQGPIRTRLQNAAVANGNGETLNTNNMATATFTVKCVTCAGGTTVNFEGTANGTDYVALLGTLSGATTTGTSTTSSTTQVWTFSVTGLLNARARISAYSSGTITVDGVAVQQGGGGGGGGGAAGTINGTVGIDQVTAHANEVVCISGCPTGGTDTDDGSIAVSQTVGLTASLGMAYDGTVWRRLTTSAAGSGLSTGLLTIQGNASGTPLPISQATAANLNATVVGTGTFATQSILTAGSAQIGHLEANQSINLVQANGTTLNTNNGAAGNGTVRVVIATDQTQLTNPLLVTLSGTNNINTVSAVTAISNALPAGTNLLGKVGIDQTTPGTTNLIALTAETTKVIGTVRNKYADGTDMLSTDIVAVASSTAPVMSMNSASANGGLNAAMACTFDDTAPQAVTENSFGMIRCSTNRNLYSTIRDAAGNERGANVNASNQLLTAPTLQAGSALAGEFVPVTTATTTDTALRCTLISAASTNATSCKGSAGNVYGYRFVNTTATLYYLRMYNLSSAPTCSSATGFIETIPIPALATGAGIVAMEDFGEGYTTGIGFCFTGGSSSTDNTNAATGVFGSILYK